jgi:hypothetical protein
VRDRLPNVNAALVLVAVVAAVGLGGRRPPVVAAAFVAALAFDAFDTAPYGTLAISRSEDLVTTVVLALVGCGAGELAVRVRQARQTARTGTDGFSRVRDAAALVAEGEEAALVVGSVAEEIHRLLGLRDCWYEAGVAPTGQEVTRQGQVRGIEPTRTPGGPVVVAAPPWDHVGLPVWGYGRRIGSFVMVRTPGVPLDRPALLVALTLADQAGAALAPFEPEPTASAPAPTPAPPGRLHLLR